MAIRRRSLAVKPPAPAALHASGKGTTAVRPKPASPQPATGTASDARSILQLQSRLGNRAVQRIVQLGVNPLQRMHNGLDDPPPNQQNQLAQIGIQLQNNVAANDLNALIALLDAQAAVQGAGANQYTYAYSKTRRLEDSLRANIQNLITIVQNATPHKRIDVGGTNPQLSFTERMANGGPTTRGQKQGAAADKAVELQQAGILASEEWMTARGDEEFFGVVGEWLTRALWPAMGANPPLQQGEQVVNLHSVHFIGDQYLPVVNNPAPAPEAAAPEAAAPEAAAPEAPAPEAPAPEAPAPEAPPPEAAVPEVPARGNLSRANTDTGAELDLVRMVVGANNAHRIWALGQVKTIKTQSRSAQASGARKQNKAAEIMFHAFANNQDVFFNGKVIQVNSIVGRGLNTQQPYQIPAAGLTLDLGATVPIPGAAGPEPTQKERALTIGPTMANGLDTPFHANMGKSFDEVKAIAGHLWWLYKQLHHLP